MRCSPMHPAPSNWARPFSALRASLWVLSLALLCLAQAKEYKYTLEDLELTCYGARMPPRLGFCDMVDWVAATATPKANFSMFADPVLITNDEQDLAAEEYYKRYATANTRQECLHGLKRLLCAKTFPECPYSGRGEGYFPPCEMFCRQVAEQCSMPIGCSHYPDYNCMVVIPEGYIVLRDKYGPYDSLPVIYGVMLTLWSAGCLLWLFVAIYSNQEYTLPLSKFLSAIPCVKVVVLILAFAFWRTCLQWRMCSYWLGVCVSNSHMVYETVVIGSFLLIAKGWSITTSTLDGSEWRNVATIMCAFYTTDAIIQVMRETLVASKSFWIATLCLYGVVFYLILVNVGVQLHKVRQQLKALQRFESPAYLVEPFKAKEFMYRMFLGLVLLFIVGQFVSHGLTMWDHRWWTVLLCYETADIVVFSIIAWTFRPQEHSPYFFMEETQPRQQEQATRLLPIIEACEAAEDDSECPPSDEEGGRVIELTPFLSRNRSKASQRQLSQRRTDRVVVVRNPDKWVQLGIADKAPAPGTTAAAAVDERPERADAEEERPERADAWQDEDRDFGPPPPPPPLLPEPFV